MKLFQWLKSRRQKQRSSDVAAKRLSVLVALDRDGSGPDFLPLLQKELIEVIKKYVEVTEDNVNFEFQRGQGFSTLEVNVELPGKAKAA